MDYSYLNQAAAAGFDPASMQGPAAVAAVSTAENSFYGDMMSSTNQYMATRGYGPTAAAAAAMRSAYGSPVSQCMSSAAATNNRTDHHHHRAAAATAMFASTMNINSKFGLKIH